MPPQSSPHATRSECPDVATTAGVPGITGGGLGLFVFLETLAVFIVIQDRVGAKCYEGLSIVISILGNVQPFGALATIAALSVMGIILLKKNGYIVLPVATCA